MNHHGAIIAAYRRGRNMTQEDLAKALACHVRTIQKMEEQERIRNVNRRWFLVGLLGIPAIELDLTGPPPWSKQTETALSANIDTMNFFENQLDVQWKLYKSAGPGVAAQTLPTWMEQAQTFQQHAQGTPWSMRAGIVLSMSYQLQGSIKRELKDITGATKAYDKALTLARESGSVENQAATILRQGLTLYYQKNTNEKAIDYYHQALKLIKDKPMPRLRGSILQSLAESHARLQQSTECWRAIDLAGHIIGREEDTRETNYVQFNKSTIDGYKGSYALYLGDYERSVMLLDKAISNPHFSSMRRRFMVRKAKALYHMGEIEQSTMIAEEALLLTRASGNTSILDDIHALYQEIAAHPQYKHETSVKNLEKTLAYGSIQK
jgi:tetratricopeptide (TPR) repeat protein/transcriptional regulator with XRE-family HTH domain